MQLRELKEQSKQFALNRTKVEANGERIVVGCEEGRVIEDRYGQPQQYVTQASVRRLLAEVKVTLDADTGQLLSWAIPERYNGATETTIDLEQAKKLASELVEIPDDAEIDEAFQETQTDSHITNIIWRHVVNDLEVEDDSIVVQINSKTHEVISLTKIWNTVTDYECRISAEDAEDIAKREAPGYVSGEEFEVGVSEQKFIPVAVDRPDGGSGSRIVKVWVANIMEPAERFPKNVELSIDCMTGDVVRVSHSK